MSLGVTRGLERSMALFERAKRVIPSATQTFSKGHNQYVFGTAPLFLERGEGARVFDVDGNVYLDYVLALFPVLLGYAHPAVNRAVHDQLERGISFSLPHRLEIEVSERLVDLIPCAEMVRFGKNGSDATGGAVRLARAYTGREVIACCGYHGWQDWYIGTTTRNRGVPGAVRALTEPFAYNDPASLEAVFDRHPGNVAAVIMEPVTFTPPEDGFLERVQILAARHGAVLIFDEICTGFRFARGGAQEFFGVTPDLACLGKAMGNGLPISVVAGRRDLMELFDDIFFSFTFGGETLSLAAAQAVLAELEARDVVGHLWRQGQILMDGVNDLAARHGLADRIECRGYPVWSRLIFSDGAGGEDLILKSLFSQEVVRRGVLILGTHNLCLAHDQEEVRETLRIYDQAMAVVSEAVLQGEVEARLEGPPIQAVFAVRSGR